MRQFLLASMSAAVLFGCAAQVQESVAQPTQPEGQPSAAVATPGETRVIMLRIYVADINRALNFYQSVFHATPMPGMSSFSGANRGSFKQNVTAVRFLNFPGGKLPMLVLIESPDSAKMNGSWVLQVPNVPAALEAAKANGATVLDTDYNAPQSGMAARSSHMVDPDGNLIEVLQLGSPSK